MNLAVIPARGGSKRIPRKNIKPFCGKPMIAWSIEAALASGCFDRVMVSTDDEEIAAVARKYGAEVPFMRSAELADDYAGTTPVIRDAILRYAELYEMPTFVCCLYATAPFVQPADLQQGLAMLQQVDDAAYAFSVTSFPAPIQRALRVNQQGRVEMFQPENFHTRSQDLEPAFHDAGQFCWGRAQAWLDQQIVFSISSLPVILPRYRVQDIDTIDDWLRAELLFELLNQNTIHNC